ncbi:MAG: pyridoxamine 5'-phosphate oxidase family protein [Planctomycetes bacterium]|nr:pyridoxamine 5'-phosphate oxidase family protein [Planctomycetota bacterium]
MPPLPEEVSTGWDDRKGPCILTTVSAAGVPNSIYVGCVKKYSQDKIVIADNYFDKTKANILAGSKGSVLFMTNGGKAYQVKGSLERQTEGAVFDDMKTWNGERPGHAAAVLTVEEVYAGAEKLL